MFKHVNSMTIPLKDGIAFEWRDVDKSWVSLREVTDSNRFEFAEYALLLESQKSEYDFSSGGYCTDQRNGMNGDRE